MIEAQTNFESCDSLVIGDFESRISYRVILNRYWADGRENRWNNACEVQLHRREDANALQDSIRIKHANEILSGLQRREIGFADREATARGANDQFFVIDALGGQIASAQ